MNSFFIVEAILIFISIILAKRMVDKRSGLAKRFVIDKEPEDDIKKMKQLTENVLSKEVSNSEIDDLTINVEIKKGKIVKVTAESEKTKVISSSENGTNVSNKAWSKKGAIAMIAFTIWAFAMWGHIIISLFMEWYAAIQRLSQMIP